MKLPASVRTTPGLMISTTVSLRPLSGFRITAPTATTGVIASGPPGSGVRVDSATPDNSEALRPPDVPAAATVMPAAGALAAAAIGTATAALAVRSMATRRRLRAKRRVRTESARRGRRRAVAGTRAVARRPRAAESSIAPASRRLASISTSSRTCSRADCDSARDRRSGCRLRAKRSIRAATRLSLDALIDRLAITPPSNSKAIHGGVRR